MKKNSETAPNIKDALLEIDQKRSEYEMGDRAEYTDVMSMMPVLSNGSIDQLLSYRRWVKGLSAKELEEMDLGKSLEFSTEHIIGSLYRLIMQEVNYLAYKKGSKNRSLQEKEDLISKAMEVLLEKMDSYDISNEASFATYAMSCIKPILKGESTKQDFSDYAEVNPVWYKVAKTAYSISIELAQSLNREPTTEEIRVATLDRFLSGRSSVDKNPSAVIARLTKSGIMKAINEDFTQILNMKGIISLDKEDEEGSNAYDKLSTIQYHDSTEKVMSETDLIQSVVPELQDIIGLNDITDELDILALTEPTRGTRIKKIFKERVTTPHVQWILLGPGPSITLRPTDNATETLKISQLDMVK